MRRGQYWSVYFSNFAFQHNNIFFFLPFLQEMSSHRQPRGRGGYVNSRNNANNNSPPPNAPRGLLPVSLGEEELLEEVRLVVAVEDMAKMTGDVAMPLQMPGLSLAVRSLERIHPLRVSPAGCKGCAV